ncbi:MAG: DivIVA domain-containing protein [Gemmatimonadota bacterium]|nr:DivIVA domain-containing protein [Gemmatimonadota bacterium]
MARVMELTPMEVRRKRGDFRTMLRGYEPSTVDAFLESAADLLEALVSENHALTGQTALLNSRVEAYQRQANAIQEALISAQAFRDEISRKATEEAQAVLEQADRRRAQLIEEALEDAKRLRQGAEAQLSQMRLRAVGETERRRQRADAQVKTLTDELAVLADHDVVLAVQHKKGLFLKGLRTLLEQELATLSVEESRARDAGLQGALAASRKRLESSEAEAATEPPTEPANDVSADRAAVSVHPDPPQLGRDPTGRSGADSSAMGEVVMVSFDLLTQLAEEAFDAEGDDSEDRASHPHPNGKLGRGAAHHGRVDRPGADRHSRGLPPGEPDRDR